ncbi:hypothetical protein [uncultured Legionella sp.]|uniref:hypothetical protein n=1 Tax=uncultured Legionella sp. TaxID=210934 RepID=UPI0026188109|nr:hypothetical protein [uncultured Legionella sp.]
MSMKLPPKSHIALSNLVIELNKAPKNDHVQRLFYLQKINYELNSIRPDENLYKWINSDDKKGFHAQLATYSINSNASFFLKGIQFAQAVALKLGQEKPEETDKQDIRDREYALMQQRDNMLQHNVFADVHEEYKALSLELYHLAYTNARMKELVEKQTQILRDVQPKIEAIKGSKKPEEIEKLGISYKTSPLGAQGNNQNYTFKMGGWNELMIWRVEDRSELKLEQRLHSHPVSKYFINDFALFTKKLQNKFEPVEYRPVVLSQFANQGNLAEVARRLQKESISNIAPQIGFYFDQLTHFVVLLMDAKAYHPDIKLTNFLADRNRILISDRKTLIDTENPMADTVRSSPMYAPDEYLECLDFDNEPLDYNAKANTTTLNMPQFMSYQLGMILKEFLILTQMDELPPAEEFRNSDKSAASYFITPPRQIINLSFLVQELTRTEASKRMTIKQFQSLLAFKNQDPDNFYKQVERVFPSSQLGIEDELNEIKALLDERNNENVFQSIARSFMDSVMPSYYGNDLLHRANKIFDKISSSAPKETRLTRMAEKLAVKCYKEYAHIYFTQCSQSVENALFNKDWEQAPWYRKAMHWLTFGLYSIERNPSPDISEIKIEQKLNGEEFQTYFPLLEFLPSKALDNLGTLKAAHFKEFLFSHLNEIVPQDSDESEESEELSLSDNELHGTKNDESTLLIKGGLKSSDKSTKNTDELSSGSIVIKDDKSEDPLPSATVIIKKKEDKAASAKSSLPDGTVIIKKKVEDKTGSSKDSLPETTMFVKKKETKADMSKDSLPANTTVIKKDDKSKMSFSFLKLSFFKKSKDDELASPATRHRLARYQRVDSVRTALLRGDSSNRTVEAEARVRVEDINWEPVSSKKR